MSLRSKVNDALQSYDRFAVAVGTAAAVGALIAVGKVAADPSGTWKSIVKTLFTGIKFIPGVAGKIDAENAAMLDKATSHFRLTDDTQVHTEIPEQGVSSEDLIAFMTSWADKERPGWRDGKVSGKVYNGSPEVIEMMNQVYQLYCVSNALHPEVFPSIRKYEAETIRMTANMLHGGPDSCGTLTSGGTESILMAMKTYREYAQQQLGIQEPEVVMSDGAHAAFDKAEEYFGIKMIRTPINPDGSSNLAAMEAAIGPNTVALVGSTPNYAHGSIDDIPALAAIAKRHNLLLHVDACLGGFFLPWAKKLGYPVPDFDFSVDGVSSMSCDTHKYGYGPKGESVLIFATRALRRFMYFIQPNWNGGIYASPTVSGSRPGAPIAGTWAVMLKTGQKGYMDAVKSMLDVRKVIVDGTNKIPELELVCDHQTPVIAWKSSVIDIFMVMDAMKKRRWILDPLQFPKAIHLCLTIRHANRGEEFIKDLAECVNEVRDHPENFKGGMAPVYGLAASVPDRTIIRSFVEGYLDRLLDVTGVGTHAPKQE